MNSCNFIWNANAKKLDVSEYFYPLSVHVYICIPLIGQHDLLVSLFVCSCCCSIICLNNNSYFTLPQNLNGWLVLFLVFNATINNISVISWWSILLVEETGVPGGNHRPVASHWQTLSHNVVSSTSHHERGLNAQIQWW